MLEPIDVPALDDQLAVEVHIDGPRVAAHGLGVGPAGRQAERAAIGTNPAAGLRWLIVGWLGHLRFVPCPLSFVGCWESPLLTAGQCSTRSEQRTKDQGRNPIGFQ